LIGIIKVRLLPTGVLKTMTRLSLWLLASAVSGKSIQILCTSFVFHPFYRQRPNAHPSSFPVNARDISLFDFNAWLRTEIGEHLTARRFLQQDHSDDQVLNIDTYCEGISEDNGFLSSIC